MSVRTSCLAVASVASFLLSLAGCGGGNGGVDDGGFATTFAVGGTTSGLLGSGLVLRNNGGDDFAVNENGAFTFARRVAQGQPYSVTIARQPTGPAQVCSVSGNSGTANADLTSVAVTCTTVGHVVGGTVNGLRGSGLLLQNNGGDDLAIAADGAFAFATRIPGGQPFAITVAHPPSEPSQTCTVSAGSGTAWNGNVTSVSVNCATNSYAVGGTVSGLLGGGLVLQNNGGDNLEVNGNGTFAFASPVPSGGAFDVKVLAGVSPPGLTCTVASGTGSVAASNVTTVAVRCTPNAYTIGGSVAGLSGAGLLLQDNLGHTLPITGNGAFTFSTALASGTPYAVTVLVPPTSPAQTCTVTHGSGLVVSHEVTDLVVTCSTRAFRVGGTVVGLLGSGLTLRNGGGDDIAVSADGTFQFPTPVASASAFAVTVSGQPTSPSQTCAVAGGSGTVVNADVSSVVVNCATNRYAVGGTATGLAGSGLSLLLNGVTALAVSANGTFAFPATLPSGSDYAVTVAAQPTSPWQTCTVASASGGVTSADVTGVQVSCTTDRHAVGGTVSGLVGAGLVLRNLGGDDLAVAGSFTFATRVSSGQPYAVTVASQPSSPTQTCTVGACAGAVGGDDVTTVVVTCITRKFAVGGTITGLAGAAVLQNNGGGDLAVMANGPFAFPAEVPSGGDYAVTVATQPTSPWQTCTVANGTGSVVSGEVTDVAVTCAANTYPIGGTVTGLAGSGLVLRNNGTDDLAIGGEGPFSFTAQVPSGRSYEVTVLRQPSSPAQTCTVTGGSGTVGGGPIGGVSVHCTTNTYTIGGTTSGLGGGWLVLDNNGGESLALSGDGTFAFARPVASGGAYAVAVKVQPTSPWQTCTVSNGSGTVSASDVTDVGVSCAPNAYRVAVNVSGLRGTGLVLGDSGADPLPITGDGLSTFARPVTSGQRYDVTVLAQPTSPWQTCTVSGGSGTVEGADVTVAVACVANIYTVSARVTGLAGTGLVLQNNSTNLLSIATGGTSSFSTPVASGSTYDVSVLIQPSSPAQVCTVTSPAGTVANADVTVSVSCPLVWVVNPPLNAVQVVIPTSGGGLFATVPVGTNPLGIAITPDGQKVYVSNNGSRSVSVISAASRAVTATIPVGTSPTAVAMDPDGSRVYVSNNGSRSVSVIDTATDTVVSTLSLPDGAGGLAVKPDGTELWVSAGYGPDILNVLSIPAYAVIHRATGMSGFIGDYLRFLPNGSVLYAGSGCGCCGNFRRFDGSTYAVLTYNGWGNPGAGVAVSPDGSRAYAGSTGSGCGGTGTLVKMNGATGSILASTSLGVTGGMVVSPDGGTLYVLQFGSPSLAVVDAELLVVVRTIALGGSPNDMAVPPL